MAVVALAAIAVLIAERSGRPGPGGPVGAEAGVQSLAVLPFANPGADAGTEYLSDGSTMTLIDTLAQLDPHALRVLSWAAVARYKGRDPTPEAVGTELKVQAVLTGHVLLRDDELTVHVELVDARDGHHIWGSSYIRKRTELQTVHEEITRAIAAKLRPGLTEAETAQLARRYPVNPEAYEQYLKGRHIWTTTNQEDRLRQAIGYFRQAIDKDRGYAPAYAGLADAYSRLGALEYLSPGQVFPEASQAAREALRRDDALADAHASLGYILLHYDWAWQEAERELRQAREVGTVVRGSVRHRPARCCRRPYAVPGREDVATCASTVFGRGAPVGRCQCSWPSSSKRWAGASTRALAPTRRRCTTSPAR